MVNIARLYLHVGALKDRAVATKRESEIAQEKLRFLLLVIPVHPH
jgi:hypothetical protein